MNLSDKVLQHFFGHLKVGNHTVFQRTNRLNIARRSTQHALCFSTHCLNRFLPIVQTNGDDRWLVENDPAFFYVNQRIGSAQIDR